MPEPDLVQDDERRLDIHGILRTIPHRYPMLLVDRIERYEPGVFAEGLKCVTVNEPYLVGHFPNHPIMPGVLIVDALAQLAGIMLRTGALKYAGEAAAPMARLGVLASIQKMRFLKPVLPGDQLQTVVVPAPRGFLHPQQLEVPLELADVAHRLLGRPVFVRVDHQPGLRRG